MRWRLTTQLKEVSRNAMSIPEQEEAKKTAREKADSTATNHILLCRERHTDSFAVHGAVLHT